MSTIWGVEGVKFLSKFADEQMYKTANMGEGGVNKSKKRADVFYGWSRNLPLRAVLL